jgi:hypothetical protein
VGFRLRRMLVGFKKSRVNCVRVDCIRVDCIRVDCIRVDCIRVDYIRVNCIMSEATTRVAIAF